MIRKADSRRRGATLVEGAVVLGLFSTIVLVMLDLGLAVFRHNTLSEAARRLAREAVVRGERSSPEKRSWGPDAYSGTANARGDIKGILEPILVTMEPDEVQVDLKWPDGGHRVGQRVRVTLRYDHQPMIPFVLGNQPFELDAVSTMQIAH